MQKWKLGSSTEPCEKRIRTTGKRPRDALTDMMTSIPKSFRAAATQADVVLQIPTFPAVRRQQSRHRVERCITFGHKSFWSDTIRKLCHSYMEQYRVQWPSLIHKGVARFVIAGYILKNWSWLPACAVQLPARYTFILQTTSVICVLDAAKYDRTSEQVLEIDYFRR